MEANLHVTLGPMYDMEGICEGWHMQGIRFENKKFTYALDNDDNPVIIRKT